MFASNDSERAPWDGGIVMIRNLEPALDLVRDGYFIFPLHAGTKIPCVPWGTESTTSQRQVTDWWEDHPADNIGINCGESDLFVVDLDGDTGYTNFSRLWKQHEKTPMRGYTAMVRTRGGRHLYFDMPAERLRNTAGMLAAKVDTRGDGGMVVAPGSVVGGKEYRWINDLPTVVLPTWLHELLSADERERQRRRRAQDRHWRTGLRPSPAEARHALHRACNQIVNAPDGTQNDTINRVAFGLRRYIDRGALDYDDVEAALLNAAEMGNHPQPRAQATIDSALRGL